MIKLWLKEILKMIVCLVISAGFIWMSFVAIMATVFNPFFMIILILIVLSNALQLYLALWFVHLNKHYDLHKLERID